jgi:hypothetical protein
MHGGNLNESNSRNQGRIFMRARASTHFPQSVHFVRVLQNFPEIEKPGESPPPGFGQKILFVLEPTYCNAGGWNSLSRLSNAPGGMTGRVFPSDNLPNGAGIPGNCEMSTRGMLIPNFAFMTLMYSFATIP